MNATVHTLYRCAVCGAPAAVQVSRATDGSKEWLCRDHLPEEVRESFDRLMTAGWKPPGRPER